MSSAYVSRWFSACSQNKLTELVSDICEDLCVELHSGDWGEKVNSYLDIQKATFNSIEQAEVFLQAHVKKDGPLIAVEVTASTGHGWLVAAKCND